MQTQTGKLKGREEELSGVVSQIKDQATQVVDRVQDTVANAQEYGEQAIKETKSFIKKYPAQAALACLGAGFLIGFLFSKR